MKSVNVVLVALAVLGLVALGGLCLDLALDPSGIGTLHWFTDQVEGGLAHAGAFRPLLGVAGAALVTGAVASVWGNISQRRWERTVVLRTPLGEVLVSLTALEDLGRLVRAEVPGVKDLKLKVTASRRGLKAVARVSLQGDVDLAQVAEAVQVAVRRRLQQVLGQDQDIRPRVMVHKLAVSAGDSEDLLEARPRLRRPPRP
jgi:hypothetical protein